MMEPSSASDRNQLAIVSASTNTLLRDDNVVPAKPSDHASAAKAVDFVFEPNVESSKLPNDHNANVVSRKPLGSPLGSTKANTLYGDCDESNPVPGSGGDATNTAKEAMPTDPTTDDHSQKKPPAAENTTPIIIDVTVSKAINRYEEFPEEFRDEVIELLGKLIEHLDEAADNYVESHDEREDEIVPINDVFPIYDETEIFEPEGEFQSLSMAIDRCQDFPKPFLENMNDYLLETTGKLENMFHNLFYPNNDGAGPSDMTCIEETEIIALCETFPQVLSRKQYVEGFGYLYPIQTMFHMNYYFGNQSPVLPFLPILAEHGDFHGDFREHERGGLSVVDETGLSLLQYLAEGDVCDGTFEVLEQLLKVGLLKKEDVKDFHLLVHLCAASISKFSNPRFHELFQQMLNFFLQLDPNALAHPSNDKHKHKSDLPLHCAARCKFIVIFELVLKAGFVYFPKQLGFCFLFQKNRHDQTPFQLACKKHSREKVIEVVERVMPKVTKEALALASIDDNIHLDGVVFLLRSNPELCKSTTPDAVGSGSDGECNHKRKRNIEQ